MAERPANSVTRWITSLKDGEDKAAEQLWARYFERVVHLARRKLGTISRRIADEEDVAISVFGRLCAGAAHGRFPELTDRDDLWRLLTVLTINRAADQQRQEGAQKRGGGKVRGDSIFADSEAGFDHFISQEPTPEFLASMADEHRRLIELLPEETLRRVAHWKMEGFTNGEIAGRLDITRRSVERKLQRIRERWMRSADP